MNPKPAFLLNLIPAVLPLLLLPACGSPGRRSAGCGALTILPSRPAPPPAAIWQPDQVAAYAVGRSVDPRDPEVVHEAHTVYRREQTRRPNLAPELLAPDEAARLRAQLQALTQRLEVMERALRTGDRAPQP